MTITEQHSEAITCVGKHTWDVVHCHSTAVCLAQMADQYTV